MNHSRVPQRQSPTHLNSSTRAVARNEAPRPRPAHGAVPHHHLCDVEGLSGDDRVEAWQAVSARPKSRLQRCPLAPPSLFTRNLTGGGGREAWKTMFLFKGPGPGPERQVPCGQEWEGTWRFGGGGFSCTHKHQWLTNPPIHQLTS